MKKKRVIIIFLIYKGKVVPNGRCGCMEVLFKCQLNCPLSVFDAFTVPMVYLITLETPPHM